MERSDYPKGHPRNPMTDQDVEAKFRTYAEPAIGAQRCGDALAALWGLEEARSIDQVLDLFTIEPGAAARGRVES